jgi:uncharacterized membrane protein YqjE
MVLLRLVCNELILKDIKMDKTKLFLFFAIMVVVLLMLFTSSVFGLILWLVIPSTTLIGTTTVSFSVLGLIGYLVYVKVMGEIRQIQFDDIQFNEEEDEIVI